MLLELVAPSVSVDEPPSELEPFKFEVADCGVESRSTLMYDCSANRQSILESFRSLCGGDAS